MKKVSIIVCTYNGQDLIKNCIDSILDQDYKNLEIVCVDGGSKDNTIKIIKNYILTNKNIKLLFNKKKLPEGYGNGKWLGINKAKGQIIGIIDQDNILQRKDLITLAVNYLKDPKTLGVLGSLKHDFSEKPVTRYISLFGTDSFFAYRSIDFIKNFWQINRNTEVIKKNLSLQHMSLTGGNCFFYTKKNLNLIGGYSKDILIVKDLITKGINNLAVINNSTIHYSESSFFKLIKKKFMWGLRYNPNNKFNYWPNNFKELLFFILNLLFCLTIIPNFFISFRLFFKKFDWVVFLFPFIAFFNTLAYILGIFIKAN